MALGKTWGLTVRKTWIRLFETNEKLARAGGIPLTDLKISAFMMTEFPSATAASKDLKRVRMYRNCYNKGCHSFEGLGPATTPSREYDENGRVVERAARSTTFGPSKSFKARVLEVLAEARDERPVVNIEFRSERVANLPKIDCSGKHRRLPDVLRRLGAGLPTLLVGPAGSGKTTLAAQAAESLGLSFTFNSMSEGASESALFGRVQPVAGGAWSYLPSPFVKTWTEGGLHLFDELDGADPNLLVSLNAALSNGLLSVPAAGPEPMRRHPDCLVIAAANTFGLGADRQYVGRNQLDAATLDRYTVGTVEVDYDEALEASIVRGTLEGAPQQAEALLAWGWAVRRKIRELKLRRILSTRVLGDSARLVRAGAPLVEAQAAYFAPWAPDEAARCGWKATQS